MHLANNTRSNIKIQFLSTKGHWNGVRVHIWISSKDHRHEFILFEEFKSELTGYIDAKYLFDLYKVQSQTRYLYKCRDTKNFLTINETDICSPHAEIITFHEASWKCVWLRSMTHHIQKMCDFSLKKNISMTHHIQKMCDFSLKKEYTNHNIRR